MKILTFGLGRIGLPIALTCSNSGYEVIGVDINKELVDKLKKGKTAFNEPGMEKLLKKHVNKTFFPKNSQEESIDTDIKDAKYIMIAVGTSFARYPEKPDLSTLYSIIGQIILAGIKGKTIILRVTIPVGTSDKIKNMIEKKTRLKEGKDFWFSFVPERIMEGKAIREESSLPKIVGTYNDEGFKRVNLFFKKIGGEIIRVSNPKTAEFIKLIDNSWRNSRFAFANELAFLSEENDINVIEAINCANKGYKRNEIPKPGPVSGYCLGKDPYLLELAFEKIAKTRGFNSLWYYGRLLNDWLIDKVIKEIKGKKVLIAGFSFKENIDDYRYSHSSEIARKALSKGCKVMICDPFIDNNYYTKLPEDLEGKVTKFSNLNQAFKDNFDTIIFATRHKEFKEFDLKKEITKNKKFQSLKIVDLWNLFPELKKEKTIIYKALGQK